MDFHALRTPEFANQVRESQKRRYRSTAVVDYVLALDEAWRKVNFRVENLQKDANKLQKEITPLHKEGKKAEAEALQKQRAAMLVEIEKEKVLADEILAARDAKANTIGNLVHNSVPLSNNEDDNIIVRTVGTLRPHDAKLTNTHDKLLYMIDGYEPDAGAAVAGHRGYFLKGVGLLLNQALINYAIALLTKKGFCCMQTPFFMKKEIMAKTAQLADFDEQLYKLPDETGDKYLIATSEQPISAYHMDEWIDTARLPLKYGGYSTNFRKEAGGHGRDVWGIFRVHQFEKIEQFVLCEPEKSWDMHEEMCKNAEEFFQSLGIAYRVVNIVSGELNDAAAKKYDIEGWFPGLNTFRELVSCSNCTDFQSRRLNITTGSGDHKRFVHMLNSTLCATSRAVCIILETYQTETGVTVPEVLRPYMGGLDFLPFKREAPKHEPQPAAGKGAAKPAAPKGGDKPKAEKAEKAEKLAGDAKPKEKPAKK